MNLATALMALALVHRVSGPAVPLAQAPRPDLCTGRATYYARGVMPRVVANRIRWRQIRPCGECAGYVAVVDCRKLGRLLWVIYKGTLTGPYMVADCANPRDLWRLPDNHIEFDWYTWWALGMPNMPTQVSFFWEAEP